MRFVCALIAGILVGIVGSTHSALGNIIGKYSFVLSVLIIQKSPLLLLGLILLSFLAAFLIRVYKTDADQKIYFKEQIKSAAQLLLVILLFFIGWAVSFWSIFIWYFKFPRFF